MENALHEFIDEDEIKDFREIITRFASLSSQKFLLRNQIIQVFRHYCDDCHKSEHFRTTSSILEFFKKCQEILLYPEYLVIMRRYDIAKFRFYLVLKDGGLMEKIDLARYLDLKDALAQGRTVAGHRLKLDFIPFYDFSPSIRDSRSIGNGIRFLNRYMCSNLFSRPGKWNKKLFEFIKMHHYHGQQLLVNGGLITDLKPFLKEVEKVLRWLSLETPDTPFNLLEPRLRKSGFEVGWGNTAGRIAETLAILLDLLGEPKHTLLEEFISRVPMPLISKVAIISPHGWFGQTNVLGKPDTGGQVIYILDQVRALETHLQNEIRLTGLDVTPKIIVLTRLIHEAGNTTCNQRVEKVFNTENGWILRVPFRDDKYDVLKQWVSRFKIWPYLHCFAEDAAKELSSEFEGRPDLIIGNYSDGNLVASLLSDKFDVIQCTIAHALEKTKYELSDLHWQDYEASYHFSIQYAADMFAMNKSDFIITSTLQEIIGTEDTIGQYESYQFFTLPDKYQVLSGIDLFAPKFNVIPPGVDEDLYFPFYEKDRRIQQKRSYWESRLFHDDVDDVHGKLYAPQKMPIFTMARFDKIKNITGLIHAFGLSEKLQQHANLIFAAGTIHLEDSADVEERNEIVKAYDLIEKYQLAGKVRWLPSINKLDTGEVYRIIADNGGIFVQPALFEAFGLTIIEAMASGLPTFAPKFGGPLEIIEYGVSGFLLNTSKPNLIANSLEKFIDACDNNPGYWKEISTNGIKRVQAHFNWQSYSNRLINLTKLYGFWRYAVSEKGMIELNRYCDLIYHFLIQKPARAMNK